MTAWIEKLARDRWLTTGEYARLLRDAGIAVTLNETKGTMHGFDIAQKAPTTQAALAQRIDFMKRMLG